MEVVCPNCGAAGQLAGKYCDDCGFAIPADATQVTPTAQADPDNTTPVDPPDSTAQVADPQVNAQGGVTSGVDSNVSQIVGAQFAVVRDGQASLNEGFTISRAGEFLVGRMDQETGHQVDIDLRQWTQPLESGGQKQYLVHRKQCYIGVAPGGVVTLRAHPGYEADTLVKAPGESTFTSLKNLGDLRPAQPDGSFKLQLHDQIFIGDPDAVMFYLSGDPTAKDNYVVLELINKS